MIAVVLSGLSLWSGWALQSSSIPAITVNNSLKEMQSPVVTLKCLDHNQSGEESRLNPESKPSWLKHSFICPALSLYDVDMYVGGIAWQGKMHQWYKSCELEMAKCGSEYCAVYLMCLYPIGIYYSYRERLEKSLRKVPSWQSKYRSSPIEVTTHMRFYLKEGGKTFWMMQFNIQNLVSVSDFAADTHANRISNLDLEFFD